MAGISININLGLPPLTSAAVARGTKKSFEIPYKEARAYPVPNGMKQKEYEIQEGDTIASIAEKFGLTPTQLSQCLQESKGTDMFSPGEEIKIPTLLEED